MPRIRYEPAPDVCRVIPLIVESAPQSLSHVDPGLVRCVRSWGSSSRAIARIYGMPRAWIAALGWNPGYVIEVLHEKYDRLPPERKLEVLVHELLHIPKGMGGGLRPHGRLVNSRRVRMVIREIRSRGTLRSILEEL